MSASGHWQRVCAVEDILPGSGVCALVGDRQIALFRVGEHIFAIDNFDPCSGANVLSRGIVGDIQGELVVASPIYKQHFSLRSGACLEAPENAVRAYPVRVLDAGVWIRQRGKLIVVGNGLAGMRAVEELLNIAPQAYDITVFGSEPHASYNRVLLSPVLSGEKQAEDIVLHSGEWYAQHGVTVNAADPIVAINRRRRSVRSSRGIELTYDRLVIATGSNPVRLPIPGSELAGVVTFRHLGDVDEMLAAARAKRNAVVIGGGVLGLEAASGLLRQGMQVTVVHRSSNLMERQLDSPAAAMLRSTMQQRGMHFKMGAAAAAMEGDTCVRAVRLQDGTVIPADIVVMAVGIRPNIELALSAGLRTDRGILVDDTLQTYDPSIYAVGECVQHRNATFGLVAPIWEQARVCAMHLAELGMSRYVDRVRPMQLKVSGIDLFSAGDVSDDHGTEAIVLNDARRGIYKRIVLRRQRVVGVVLYGDTKDAAWYLDLMLEACDVSAIRDQLLFGIKTRSVAVGTH